MFEQLYIDMANNIQWNSSQSHTHVCGWHKRFAFFFLFLSIYCLFLFSAVYLLIYLVRFFAFVFLLRFTDFASMFLCLSTEIPWRNSISRTHYSHKLKIYCDLHKMQSKDRVKWTEKLLTIRQKTKNKKILLFLCTE